MTPIKHPLCNHIFKAPANWDSEMPCDDLHVALVEEPGLQGFMSFWRPDAKEMALLVAGKPVALTIYGSGHPVVSLGVVVEDTQ